MVAMTLLARGLGSGPLTKPIYSYDYAETLRITGVALAAASMLADVVALYWFNRMKKKFRHGLIMLLLAADFFKSATYVAFGVVMFFQKNVTTSSAVCQATGAINEYFVEITDLVILSIIGHMSVQVMRPDSTAMSEGGLQRFDKYIYAGIITIPLGMAATAFANPHGGYALAGAFCGLPIRPFWYRLALSWIPRYFIAVTIITLTIMIRIKVKGFQKKLAELQPQGVVTNGPGDVDEIVDEIIEEESDDEQPESPSKNMESMNGDPEKKGVVVTQTEITEQEETPKWKRMSYKPRIAVSTLNINTGPEDDATRTQSVSSMAQNTFSHPNRNSSVNDTPIRQNNAVDLPSPINSLNRQSGIDQPSPLRPVPGRRSSVADFSTMRSNSTTDVTSRRRSVDLSASRSGSIRQSVINPSPTSGPERSMSNSNNGGRRKSIWDEIDASLEKKAAPNRMSIFTITASEYQPSPSSRNASPERSPSRDSQHIFSSNLARASRISQTSTTMPGPGRRASMVRRAMSIISLRGVEPEEDPESPAAILRRRHRYIQRQMRFMMFYPVVYVLLWLFPFVLHVLQYTDRFAASPPRVLAALSIVELTTFGLVNSVVFCMREKPWATVPDGDGTVWGSLRTDPVVRAVRKGWRDVRGKDDDELDFAG